MALRTTPAWMANQPTKLEAIRRAIRPADLGLDFVLDLSWAIHNATPSQHREWMTALSKLSKDELRDLGRLALEASSPASIALLSSIEVALGHRISRRRSLRGSSGNVRRSRRSRRAGRRSSRRSRR